MTPTRCRVADAALYLARALSEALSPGGKRWKALRRPLRAVKALFRARWKRQRDAILEDASPALERLAGQRKEAAADANRRQATFEMVRRALAAVTARLTGAAALDELTVFDAALVEAIGAGMAALASDMGLEVTTAAFHSFEANYLADHGFIRIVGDIDATTFERVANAVAEAYEKGGNYEALTQAIKDTFADFPQKRVDLIAQTELNNAYNAGVLELGRQMEAAGKSWHTTSDNPCEICLANQDEGIIPLDQDFKSGDEAPTAHPRCLLGGTFITAFGVSAQTRRWYEGQVCTIKIPGVPDLAVTPNHPILGPCGWVEARLLKAGDYVFQRLSPAGSVFSGLGDPDNHNREPRIEEVFDAALLTGSVSAAGVPLSPEAFHGDVGSDCEVDIVWSASTLSEKARKDSQNFEDLLLASPHFWRKPFTMKGNSEAVIEGLGLAAASIVSCGSLGLFLLRSHHGDPKALCLSLVPLIETKEPPVSRDRRSADSNAAGNSEYGFSSQVRLVQITEVKVREVAAHVYNLETESGIYFANSIVAHNCYCNLKIHAEVR